MIPQVIIHTLQFTDGIWILKILCSSFEQKHVKMSFPLGAFTMWNEGMKLPLYHLPIYKVRGKKIAYLYLSGLKLNLIEKVSIKRA